MSTKPHIYGLLVRKVSPAAPAAVSVIVDFQHQQIVEDAIQAAGFDSATLSKLDGEEQTQLVRERLIARDILPFDAELHDEVGFQALYEKANASSLRKDFYKLHDHVIPNEIQRIKDNDSMNADMQGACLSDLERASQILSGDKPLTMLEAVRDFLELGPCIDHVEAPIVTTLTDLAGRVALYASLPSAYSPDALINDPMTMDAVEMRDFPERIRGHEADEIRKSFGPEPI